MINKTISIIHKSALFLFLILDFIYIYFRELWYYCVDLENRLEYYAQNTLADQFAQYMETVQQVDLSLF